MDNLVIVTRGGQRTLLLACERELIEKYEKLCGVYFPGAKKFFLKSKSRSTPDDGALCHPGVIRTVRACMQDCGRYLTTTYQRKCSKELFKFQGGRETPYMMCIFTSGELCL